MANPRNFIKNSDYPIDQIVLMKSGSVVLSSGSEVSIAHGLPFTPLVLGSWSYDINFTTSYNFQLLLYAFADSITLSADSTNLKLSANFTSTGNKTVYYRIFAFMPSTYTAKVSPPNISTGWRLNSDLNYLKLFVEGKINASGGTQTINHNLGYQPTCILWIENVNGIFLHNMDDFETTNGSQIARITNTQLIIYQGIVHYRIYYDD